MKRPVLDQMAAAAQAIYLREHHKIQDVLSTEARLRQSLARLDAQAEQARRQTPTDHSMRAVGADILWQGWVTRTRKQLNIELAQVMALKLTAMDRIRIAFGRRQAIRRMLEETTARRRKLLLAKFE